MPRKESKCSSKQDKHEEEKQEKDKECKAVPSAAQSAVQFAVQRPPDLDFEARLDKEFLAISENSKALANFADSLEPVLMEHDEALLRLMDILPQLQSMFSGAQLPLQSI